MLVVKEMTLQLDAYLVIQIMTLIAKDLSKQQAYNDDSKAIQQIIFTGNTTIFFIIEERKETILNSSQGKYLKVFHNFFFGYKITHYHIVNVKLSDLQLDKLKSATKILLKYL